MIFQVNASRIKRSRVVSGGMESVIEGISERAGH